MKGYVMLNTQKIRALWKEVKYLVEGCVFGRCKTPHLTTVGEELNRGGLTLQLQIG